MAAEAFNDPFSLVFIGAFGLVFGSFATALSYRLPRGESIAHGRSKCPACQHTLTAPDLVPVVSWIAHKGACRHCGARISWRYPAIEVVMSALFLSAAVLVQDGTRLLIMLGMTFLMVVLAIVDLEHKRVPNVLLVPLALLALLWRWHADGDVLFGVATGTVLLALGVLIDLIATRVAHQPGLGMGDTKLFAAIGCALTPASALLFVGIAGLLGVFIGLLWRWRSGARQFPFAPAILASGWICILGAEKILHTVVMLRSG
jgi:leader peptidase (prepilin peptidase)/N-methyltransferase